MYYRAQGKAVCADVIPFYDRGEFKLFYLEDFRDRIDMGEGCPWKLLTTKDLVHYRNMGTALPRGTKDEQDLYVFTGCCVKIEDEYVIYYTGHNPHLRAKGLPEQKILRATSKDMLHWEKDRDFVFEAPEYLEMHDFRDPFVYFDEEKGKYGMLIAARVKSEAPVFSKGVTMVAYSEDGYNHWELDNTPFYAPHAFFAHECPDLFRIGDWWYLVFSEFTDKVVTTYRMSRSLNGPWTAPKVNAFDGHAFYAAKSVSDGKRRIMFGWNCIRNNEHDGGEWQWGGTIIPHEVVQGEDGALYVRCPDEVRASYRKEVRLKESARLGGVEKTAKGYRLGDDGKNVVMFHAPQNFKLEFKIVPQDDRGEFGVILRENSNQNYFYTVRFEPKFNRLAFDRYPRCGGRGPIDADTERYCPMEAGKPHVVLIIAEGSVLEVYVDDKYAMSERMFDFFEGNVGVYAQNTTAAFEELKAAVYEDEQ